MPEPINDTFSGPRDDGPYVPSWCYRKGPRMCPCGHHEGYHNDAGVCHLKHKCKCIGLPAECLTPNDELRNRASCFR